MTKLEAEIKASLLKVDSDLIDTNDIAGLSQAAAEVAKKWMREAWEGAVKRRVHKGDAYTITFEEWLKEKGITE